MALFFTKGPTTLMVVGSQGKATVVSSNVVWFGIDRQAEENPVREVPADTSDGDVVYVEVSPDEYRGTFVVRNPCELCHMAEAVKTDSQSRSVCERCAVGAAEPVRGRGEPCGRNDACPCGSGRKYKKCCKRG